MKGCFTILSILVTLSVFAQQRPLTNDTLIPVHDPVIIRQDSTYYIFCTGQGIAGFSSTDMKHWKQLKPVFNRAPQWAVKTIPGFRGHIWAPDISFHNGQYYYLFVSYDYCFRGEKSTYKMMVGRSEKVIGPYIDRDGVPMNLGGGSVVLEGEKNRHGVGHNAMAAFNGFDYLVYHAYDAGDKGHSKLQIEKINWINGWPYVSRRPVL